MTPDNTIRTYDYSGSVFASQWGDEDADFQSLLFKHGRIEAVQSCPYCLGHISHWKTTEYPDTEFISGVPVDIDLVLCSICGWYRYRTVDYMDAPPTSVVHRVALLGKEAEVGHEPPLQELRRYLAKNWNKRAFLSPSQAESIVADVFKEHLDCEVRYTTNGVYTPDGGIDFVLVNTNSGIEYAFQVKRRLMNSPERIQPIREFVGAVAGTSFQNAYYVTTAARFTKTAQAEIRDAIKHLTGRRISLSIVDGDTLLQLLKEHMTLPKTADVIRAKFSLSKVWKYHKDSCNDNLCEGYDEDEEYSLEEMLTLAFPM